MEVTEVKVWTVKDGGKVKARGFFVVDDTFRIQYTLFQGTKGMFVGLPGRYGNKTDENGKKIWYSDVKCLKEDVLKSINNAVIGAYNDAQGGAAESQGEAAGPTNQTGMPF